MLYSAGKVVMATGARKGGGKEVKKGIEKSAWTKGEEVMAKNAKRAKVTHDTQVRAMSKKYIVGRC